MPVVGPGHGLKNDESNTIACLIYKVTVTKFLIWILNTICHFRREV